MADASDVFMAAAHQTGCFVRTGPDESMDLALCLSALPLPRGRRVAIMTLGGGWGVLAADELARNDLELAALEGHWKLATVKIPVCCLALRALPQRDVPVREAGGRVPRVRCGDTRQPPGRSAQPIRCHYPSAVQRSAFKRPSQRADIGR
jgi:hypothetical protein